MQDYDKPQLKNGEPLKLLECASHHCIRCVKKGRAFKKLGYEVHGMGNRISYGVNDYNTYVVWQNERQFKSSIKAYIDIGVNAITWNNEPDLPAIWIRQVITDMNKQDDVKLVSDLHDLDSVRRKLIPLEERKMINISDGLIYVSLPIEKETNELHKIIIPTTTIYSYCNEGIIEYDEDKIGERSAIVYEGGANPPEDTELNKVFSYRSLYDIMRKLVAMGNEVHMFCGNVTAVEPYSTIGVVCYPPALYDEMMKGMLKFKYGVLVFNNHDGKKDQVNLTLTNKMHEYLQCGIPSLACWCPESEKYVKKHNIGFTFNHIDEIGDCSQLNDHYIDVMNNIKTKRKELVMENFISRVENLYAEVHGIEGKSVPKRIQKLQDLEYKGE